MAAGSIPLRLKEWARAMKREIAMLWLAARDPRTPVAAKLVAGLTAAYALSPIDLIPDFIPVLGLLDDLLIVPLGIWLALRLIPAPLADELRRKAQDKVLPKSRNGLIMVVATWVIALALFAIWWTQS